MTIRRGVRDDPTLVNLTPAEAMFGLAVVGATSLGLLSGGPTGGFVLWVAVYGTALLAVTLLVVKYLRLDPALGRALAGVSLTFVVYGAMDPLIAPLGARAIDPFLQRVEEGLLGTTLVQMVEPMASPFWTDVFTGVYSLHVPLFLLPAALHWWAGRPGRAERLLLTLALCMYVGFVGYIVFPAYGPVGTMTGLRPIGDNAATVVVAMYGVALGTFPSLHAGISAAVAIDGWRTSWRWGILYTLVAALIWFSTIYLRYHWALDLLAGLALAGVCTWLAGWLLVACPTIAVRWPRLEDRARLNVPAEGVAGE